MIGNLDHYTFYLLLFIFEDFYKKLFKICEDKHLVVTVLIVCILTSI